MDGACYWFRMQPFIPPTKKQFQPHNEGFTGDTLTWHIHTQTWPGTTWSNTMVKYYGICCECKVDEFTFKKTDRITQRPIWIRLPPFFLCSQHGIVLSATGSISFFKNNDLNWVFPMGLVVLFCKRMSVWETVGSHLCPHWAVLDVLESGNTHPHNLFS